MNHRRIAVSLLHSLYHLRHSMETWVDLFWNSSLQMVVFAFIAVAFSGGQNSLHGTYMIVGMIFWNVIWAAQYGVTVGVLWEVWSKSFSSMFITPLTLEEFLVGQSISSAIKGVAALLLTAIIGVVVYKFSLLVFGWMIVIYFIELFVFGISAGLFILSLILRWGTQIQSFSWAIVFLVQPFGAVFYPVSILPVQIRWISYGIPTTYIFETIRKQLATGVIQTDFLVYASFLNILYFIASYLLLKRTFTASKKSGAFARLEG